MCDDSDVHVFIQVVKSVSVLVSDLDWEFPSSSPWSSLCAYSCAENVSKKT